MVLATQNTVETYGTYHLPEAQMDRFVMKISLGYPSAKEEMDIISHLASFEEEIISAAKEYDPTKITRYVTTLATLFHKFYNACRVKGEDEVLTQARLNLCVAVKTVIHNVLTMFNISCPESM